MRYIFIIFLFISSLSLGQVIYRNNSPYSWVLVYQDTTVITIVEPGHHTETIFILLEFQSKDDLDNYILGHNLFIKKDEA